MQSLTASSVIDQRIRQKLSTWEIFSISICICLSFIFAWYYTQGYSTPYDYSTYLQAGFGDLSIHYYAFWILPIFRVLAALPPALGFVIWNMANIGGVFYAARVFGGRIPLILLSYQMMYVLYYGQIIGILIGALALFYWALKHRRFYLAGLCFLIACTKPQFGCTFGLVILFLLKLKWGEWLKILIVPVIISIFSLIVYPLWPLESLMIISTRPPNSLGNISLWQWIGPFALLLWIPPVTLPLSFRSRFIALSATIALTMPYFQQTDLLMLFVLPTGLLSLLGNLGYVLYWEYGPGSLKVLVIVPLTLYVVVLLPVFIDWLSTKKSK